MPLSFTFQPEEWRRAKQKITRNSKLYEAPKEGEMPSVKLPKEERHRSRWFTLEDVFGEGPLGKESELSWFYDLTAWEEYCKLILSGHIKDLSRPYGFVTGHISTGDNDSE